MPYNFVLTVFTQKKFVADFLQAKSDFFYANRPFCVFRPPLEDLGATYDDHLRLIGKRVVDFLLNWIFFTRCYSLGAMSDYRFKIGDFAPTGVGWPKIHVERVAPTNHSSSQKTRLNVLSYDIKIWTDLSSILSGITRVTDGRTDGQTNRILIARRRLHFMQRGKN